jgi:hypothetical protein
MQFVYRNSHQFPNRIYTILDIGFCFCDAGTAGKIRLVLEMFVIVENLLIADNVSSFLRPNAKCSFTKKVQGLQYRWRKVFFRRKNLFPARVNQNQFFAQHLISKERDEIVGNPPSWQ